MAGRTALAVYARRVLSGELLGGRFRIDALADAGGMGAVYRACDIATGKRVAAKVLHDPSPHHLARFAKEAELLARLSHPGIVRYIAYDAARGSRPFLVMEWLEGEALSRLLARRCLTIDEAVELGARVAAALGAAHARGIVHRDLKPSNIFLVGGRIAEPKLLDFGIAYFPGTAPITGDGVLVGTPEYMAPEQARCGDEVGPPVDVFSLGCVLFECLTGAPPFRAGHLVALLARIIFDEAPLLLERRPDAPLWLAALLSQMLEKSPARRPRDGAAVLAALTAQEAHDAPASAATISAITGSERRFHGVVVVGRAPCSALDVTLSPAELGADAGALGEVAACFGGRLERLADGTSVIILSGPRVPTDVAAQLARCAMTVKERDPDRPIAITVGWGELGRGLPVGDAIERAAALLRSAGHEPARAPRILLDDVTATLLETRFDAARAASGALELLGERVAVEASRLLLGRPAPFVGRTHELRLLEHTFAASADDPAAHAMLILGAAGTGKSRLLKEHLAALRRSGARVEIWAGRGDALRAGSTGGLLAEAIRDAAGIKGSEPIEQRRALLRARVARRVPRAEQRRVEEFLGELAGVPFPDEDSLPLRAARKDPDLLGEQMQRALRGFLRAECAAQPVLLALEDLHWADRASIAAISAALRELADQPLLVLATARPEIKQAYPDLWAEHGRQELWLRQLSPKACARLAREVLGDAAGETLVARVVEQSDGHPFFLEELIRATAEGRGDALPETVVAMVQVRLEALPPHVRRVLRAASVFGEVFWRGAVSRLLGGDEPASVQECLSALVAGELCLRHGESRFPGEEEYAFRHALLREGAYALLTEEDRALGHRLAAEWLEAAGEADPLVLAAHCERGGLPVQAATLNLRGAELASARRAYLDAEGCYARAEALLGVLPPGARRGLGLTRFRLGRHPEALADLAAAREAAAEQEPGATIDLLLDEAMVLDWSGEYRAAAERVEAAERLAGQVASPLLRARLLLGVGRSLHRACREEEAAAVLTRASAQAAELGDQGYETHLIAGLLLGFILAGLGRVEEAARILDEVIRGCEERSDLLHLGAALNNRALVRALRGDRAGMIADLERTIELGRDLDQPALELVGHYNLAEYLYLMDDLEAATRHARATQSIALRSGDHHAPTAVTLLTARLRLYRGDEARARAAVQRLRAASRGAFGEALSPAEDVLCAMVELATSEEDDAAAWAALEERSRRCSVGQERIEVLEARALALHRRGRRAEARAQLERALAAAATIPNVMGGRLRRWHREMVDWTEADAPSTSRE
ncbi:protein kinase [Sorangium sp. So ce1036]|uniref:serine/threonine-protein kinase n=1 Tax=Sorangium sp. So ce1036 TaxID=3133328 RepID=UPI003EFC5BA7